jgi:hypothetical protein
MVHSMFLSELTTTHKMNLSSEYNVIATSNISLFGEGDDLT